MKKEILIAVVFVLTVSAANASAQNTNTSPTVRPRTTTSAPNTNKSADPQRSTDVQRPATTQPAPSRTAAKPKVVATDNANSQTVAGAFNALLNGIRHADVKAVSSVYWNSPRLILFNNNGSVTKGWEQMRKNRESSYRDMKDVTLTVRDVAISMLGRDGAVVSCLWTQSQTYKGNPETATGRMTLVFKKVGTEWKAIHLHTSTDKPQGVPASEQAEPAAAKPTP
jgi:ketosteroid isomerase-like protein